jgi:cell division protein FtsQ
VSALRPAAVLAMGAIALATLAAAAGALAWASRLPRFDVRVIEVRADAPADAQAGSHAALRHVSRAQVRAAVSGRLRAGWFSMRLGEARAVFESIPWVAGASVRRVWPGRLVATLRERHSVGVWDDGRMLGDDGTLFAGNIAEAELDGPQVQFSGPPHYAPQASAELARWNSDLAAMGSGLARVDISERGSWTLRSQSGQAFELGRDDPPGSIDRRIADIRTQYPAVLAHLGAAPTRVDARYGNGFTVNGP